MTSKKFNITFLGTSAASLSPNVSTSAYLVEIDQTRILVDAGLGALRQLRKLKISLEEIDIILITHWHIDHYFDLPAILRAKRNFGHISAYGPAIPLSGRSYLGARFGPLRNVFTNVEEDFSLSTPELLLQAIPNSHFGHSYGWAIIEKGDVTSHKGRRLVISGDTKPTETIAKAAYGADLLVHEATYMEKDARFALIRHHSTSRQAAELAVKATVGALALTHIPRRYSHGEILAEAQEIFPEVLIPFPLDTIHIEPRKITDIQLQCGWANIQLTSLGLS